MSEEQSTIPNEGLGLTDIPPEDADWEAIGTFALTFNGYKELGSFDKCAEIANERKHSTLTELRTCLFFEQRRWRHYGDEPDSEAMAYIRDVMGKIRRMVVRRTRV